MKWWHQDEVRLPTQAIFSTARHSGGPLGPGPVSLQSSDYAHQLRQLERSIRTEIHTVLGPFTRSRESLATGLPATENTWLAARAFTRATVCVKSAVDSVIVAFRLLSLQNRKSSGWQQNHAVCVSLQTRDILHGDSKHIHAKCRKEFVNWVVLSLNSNLNNQRKWFSWFQTFAVFWI